MKINFISQIGLCILLVNTYIASSQVKKDIKYSFNFIENAERLSGSKDTEGGLLLYFRFWNKDEKIGNGGGWLIYKNGTMAAYKLANELYPNNSLVGRYFIDDLFQRDSENPNVDTTMLNDFDIYLYIINNKYLEKRMNIDGEGAGKTYSYYETYPLDIEIFRRKAGDNFFLKIDNYHVKNENEYQEKLKQISEFKKKTAIQSNQ